MKRKVAFVQRNRIINITIATGAISIARTHPGTTVIGIRKAVRRLNLFQIMKVALRMDTTTDTTMVSLILQTLNHKSSNLSSWKWSFNPLIDGSTSKKCARADSTAVKISG